MAFTERCFNARKESYGIENKVLWEGGFLFAER